MKYSRHLVIVCVHFIWVPKGRLQGIYRVLVGALVIRTVFSIAEPEKRTRKNLLTWRRGYYREAMNIRVARPGDKHADLVLRRMLMRMRLWKSTTWPLL